MTPEERLAELRNLAKGYAADKAQQTYLDHFRKSKLAILTAEYMAQGDSHNAAESKARTREEYLEVLEGLKEATKKAEAAYWELRIAEWGVKIWQSKQATTRAEMSLT